MFPPQLKLSAILGLTLAVIAALAATNYGSYKWGYDNASTLHELRYEKRETALREQITKAQQSVLDAERGHAAAIAQVRTAYEKQAQDAAVANAATIANLRSAEQRVRVKVTDCHDPAVPKSTAAASEPDGSGTAELNPEVAARIWAIAADGERAIRKLIALQAWAREAVELCR